jgi:hypothetical protein
VHVFFLLPIGVIQFVASQASCSEQELDKKSSKPQLCDMGLQCQPFWSLEEPGGFILYVHSLM